MVNRLLHPFSELELLDRVLAEPLDNTRLDDSFSVQVTQFPVDLYETQDEFRVYAYLPGIPRDHVELSVDRNLLTIKAERPMPNSDGARWIHMESPYGTFYRTIALGNSVQSDRAEAVWQDGMLVVRLPKVEHARAKVIPIQVASHDAESAKGIPENLS